MKEVISFFAIWTSWPDDIIATWQHNNNDIGKETSLFFPNVFMSRFIDISDFVALSLNSVASVNFATA